MSSEEGFDKDMKNWIKKNVSETNSGDKLKQNETFGDGDMHKTEISLKKPIQMLNR